jgi:hypothetical protein
MADNELSTELYVMQYHIFTRIQRQIESMAETCIIWAKAEGSEVLTWWQVKGGIARSGMRGS